MTYCVAMRLADGLLFVSDSRTNAGVDHIATFRKLYIFGVPGERFMALQSSGNLATAQSVVTLLQQRLNSGSEEDLYQCKTMFEAATLVGRTIREVLERTASSPTLLQGVDLSCSFLLGGQLPERDTALYNIYPQGNFIKATDDTPYFQIGESKYGKPILDRALYHDTAMVQALRCALISFDSTIRSNLSVGMPLDVAVYRKDSYAVPKGFRVYETDRYFQQIRAKWSHSLSRALRALPEPPGDYWE